MATGSRSLELGIHLGQQNISIDEVRALWRFADTHGFAWMSIWDHFYDAGNDAAPHFEAIALLGAMAAETTRLRFGCMVFSVHYRNLGVLAKAMITIDHLSGGRVEFGLGAGWHKPEYDAFGYTYGSDRERLNDLEEAMIAMQSLLRDDVTSHHGTLVHLNDAKMFPKPLQQPLPLWVGGKGERRTARIAARYADGWNIPYVSAEEYAHKMRVLDQWCAAEGRDPATIKRAVQLGMYTAATSDPADVERGVNKLRTQMGRRAASTLAGHLTGGPSEVIEKIATYRAAGVTTLNIAIRPPIDWDALHAFAQEVLPVVTSDE